MRKANKFLSVILAILLVISIIPITASAAASGGCGENVTWKFDDATGTLTISGTGNMNDYLKNNRPKFETYKSQIETIIINDGVSKIGTCAFYGYTNLKNVTIPNSVITIEISAFYGCTNLTSIVIPDSVNTIGSNSFGKCTNLANITISDSVTSIGYRAFANTAYSNDESNWESDVLYIGNHLYQAKDTIVENYKIKNGTITIADSAFNGCETLTNIAIPDSVTTIGNNAFFACNNLTNITIPATVTLIGAEVFNCCENLTDIVVDNENPYYSSDEYGVLFDKNKTILIKCPEGNLETFYKIPDSVLTIEPWAFRYCYNLEQVTIPDSVTTIGDHAFYYCSNLTDVKIGKGVTKISDWMFGECVSLETFTIPDNITRIGEYAFYWCDNITNVIIGKNVTSIGWAAFNECTDITDVYYSDTKNQWNSIKIEKGNDPILDATLHYNHAHNYNSVVTSPTCTEQGYTTYTCECSNAYIDDYVEALGHDMIIDEAVSPDCVNTGLTEGSHCSRCDDATTEQEIVSALGHSHDTVTTPPTCTEQGYTTHTCECGDSYVDDYVDATGHSHISEIITPATHATTGIMTFTCACGDTYTETIDKLAEHNYEMVVTAPTCTEQGYTTYTCYCGDSYVDDYVDAIGHIYGEWVVTKEATVDAEGEMERVCSCGEKEYKVIEKLPAVDNKEENVENPDIPNTNSNVASFAYSVFILITFACATASLLLARRRRCK